MELECYVRGKAEEVGKRKETPKEREFFLMNEKQDDIQIHPDSEMMMVMSHEELLQTIQYREFVDSKGEFAIIKLPDGKMTVVNRQGEQVIEPGNYYDMKFLQGNILSYRPRRKDCMLLRPLGESCHRRGHSCERCSQGNHHQ